MKRKKEKKEEEEEEEEKNWRNFNFGRYVAFIFTQNYDYGLFSYGLFYYLLIPL